MTSSPSISLRSGATDAMIFFGLWLQRPLAIAATNPSGIRLAYAVARCIDFSRPGPVLELGAGTGSLTNGLLRAGCPPGRIIAFEREPRLADVLRRKFPKITVIEDDATQVGHHITSISRLCGVISSLPIKWFPLRAQRAIVYPCLELLGPTGSFLQLTNAFSSPLPTSQLAIAGREIGRVWFNLLPTQIWSYSEPPKPGQ